jgi:hypothetical protein
MRRLKRPTLLAGVAFVLAAVVGADPVAAARIHYSFVLRGDGVVGSTGVPEAGDPDARVVVGLTVDAEGLRLCLGFGGLRELATPTAVHLHRGSAGTNGPVVAEFEPPSMEGATDLCEGATPELIEDILANSEGYYLDLHTAEFPDGAVRNQLRLAGCTLSAWVPGQSEGEGGSSPFLSEGERIQIRGTFFGGLDVEYALAREGDVLIEGTQHIPEGQHAYDWFFTFDYEASGEWTFHASVPHVAQCEDELPIVVTEGTPTGSGTPPSLPDTALSQSPVWSVPIVWEISAAVVLALMLLLVRERTRS